MNVFIGGAAHSGTTLLNNLLKNHSEAFATPCETRFVENLDHVKSLYAKLEGSTHDFFVDLITNGVSFLRHGHAVQYEIRDIEEITLPNTKDFLKDFNTWLTALKKNEKVFFVEKTPSNVSFIKEILDGFEDVKVLIIHRDIRDVEASHKKRVLSVQEDTGRYGKRYATKKLEKDYNTMIGPIMWSKLVKNSLRFEDDSRVKVIRYEDLVGDAEKVMKEVCEFLSIDFQPAMLTVEGRNAADEKTSVSKGIDSSSVGNYEKVFTPIEIDEVHYFSGKYLKKLRHDVPNLSFSSKLKVILRIPFQLWKLLMRIFKRMRLFTPRYFFRYLKANLIKVFK